jgi:hypothetical protein
VTVASAPAIARPQAPAPAEDGRALEAMLRARTRWLGRHAGTRVADAARLFPVLLHASFQKTRLEDEAPGVSGMRYRRSWSRWAAGFGLPPPSRAQRGTCLAEAVVACPGPHGLELMVLVPRGLKADERHRLEARVGLAAEVLRKGGVQVLTALLDPVQLAAWESALRALLFGALVAGRPAPPTWSALSQACASMLAPEELARLSHAAPTPLSALAVALLAGSPRPGPLEAIRGALGAGTPARELADADVATVAWAAPGAASGDDLRWALRLAHTPPARKKAERPLSDEEKLEALRLELLGLSPPPAAAEPETPAPDDAEVLKLGRRLAAAYLRIARTSRTLRASPRWRDALSAGFPRVLLPVLGARLRETAAAGQLDLDPVPALHGFEVRLRDGSSLGHGATPVQARARALALVAEAGGEELLAGIPPPWKALSLRLTRPRARPAVLLVAEAASGNEPPFDPINRGPRRELGFPAALVARLAPGREPTARVLASEEAVETFLRAAHDHVDVEVVPARPEARPVAVRLAEVAARLGARVDGAEPDPAVVLPGPAAIQAGGRVYLAGATGLRRFPLGRFLARPRAFTADPDAPDLALRPGDRKGLRRHTPGLVQVRVSLAGPQSVFLLYADRDVHFREEVPLRDLEEHLRDVRAALYEGAPGSGLALLIDPDVEPALRKAGVGAPSRRLEIALRGEPPHRLEVRVAGEWFGGPGRPGWGAAALAATARWVPGEEGRLACRSAALHLRGGKASPLAVLWARGAGLRRLRAHIHRALRPYRAPGESRRAG